MSIQLSQLIVLLVWVVLAVLFYRINNNKFRIAIVFMCLVLFLFNPIKFKQEGVAKLERMSSEVFTELPVRISEKELSFEEKQENQMSELKKQSKESVENEIN